MLIGQYQHSLDTKGRMIMPAKLRESLGERFILTYGLDNCLFVYSMEEWALLEEKVQRLPLAKGRKLQLFFFANACEVETDSQGRILIPAALRKYAHLSKETVVIGASVRAEIWDKKAWEEASSGVTVEDVTQAMNDLEF